MRGFPTVVLITPDNFRHEKFGCCRNHNREEAEDIEVTAPPDIPMSEGCKLVISKSRR